MGIMENYLKMMYGGGIEGYLRLLVWDGKDG